MAVSEAAQRNHDAMFPDHHSTLKVTDPGLVELFGNWAFDEVMRDAPLDPRTHPRTLNAIKVINDSTSA
jgi:4-carboxymuconolactone decarboxylase